MTIQIGLGFALASDYFHVVPQVKQQLRNREIGWHGKSVARAE
jgi:hypothetical protein